MVLTPYDTRMMSAKISAAWLAALALSAFATRAPVGGADNVDTIDRKDVLGHLNVLASPPLEGRDTPSLGQALAARYIAARFAEFGLAYADDSAAKGSTAGYRPWLPAEEDEAPATNGTRAQPNSGTYFRPWTRAVEAPVPGECELQATFEGEEPVRFEYGREFVPVQFAEGSAEGELVFCGFGITDKKYKYDDFKGLDAKGKIALILEGEPNHKRKFDGPEVTPGASLWMKMTTLKSEKVAGVLIVRREEGEPADGGPDNPGPAFRFSYASWAADRGKLERPPSKMPPALVISEATATRLLGTDVAALGAKLDRGAKPVKWKGEAPVVSFRATTELQDIATDNVVGLVKGTELPNEFVIVGAHYDHIGAGPRGRVGLGADDNGSGTSALLEVAQAMADAEPRRSLCFVAFSGEEDGLLGAKAFCRNLPFEKEQIVAMVNLDMIGRGDAKEVVLLGLKYNPKLEDVVERARRLSSTGIKTVTDCRDDGLFQRSDHYAFHSMLGVPVLFFFENYPVEKNPDYHTWRDTVDTVDVAKITNTAKLVFNTAWLLANDDERPPKPNLR